MGDGLVSEVSGAASGWTGRSNSASSQSKAAAKATALLGNTEDAYGQVWHLPTDPGTLTARQMVDLSPREMGGPAGISILPMWLLKLLGLFMPIMREMPEMMYQYDRDYIFDSGKFTARFGIHATSYAQGVKATVSMG